MTAPPPPARANDSISVIIPALNEAEILPRALEALRPGEIEVLVVDGVSTDRTREIAESLGAVVLGCAVRQRAHQMNFGAARAGGGILWFLHADTIAPPSAPDRIRQALRDERVAGGAFARKFDSPSLVLQFTCLLAEWRNRSAGWHLGDQGIFVRRGVFGALGGFRDFDRFEDLDFSRRMRRLGRLATLRPPVVTSARRFKRFGPARQTLRDFLLTLRYLRMNTEDTESTEDTERS